ncbi:HSP20-like chaperone [Ascobolus immersus RN42]|uniref:HSP20-like chaperone n=1 Tax=Ascobolus immersus RN42 TaxID=1160509 RepID=A0A3N4IP73_ASCIM|nr:HSP20-like chaperone [Ascobolus immersus RN42]
MSLFRPFNSPLFSEFRPLLRALNDQSLYAGLDDSSEGSSQSTSRRAFSPNFDVHETDSAYVLEGEVPGLSDADKKNLEIEFTDENTLLIRGKIERSYKSQSPSESEADKGKDKGKESHKASVEDEPEGQVTKTSDKKEVQKKSDTPNVRYWVSERSIGSFQRSFTFPGLIDQDAVTAKLKDGVLTINVPKRQAPAAKKITVQ